MSYTPHTWQPGEIISSARLNALEQGVAAGGGGGGYDAEILAVHNGSSVTCSIISGTYAAIAAMLENDEVPRILVRYKSQYTGEGWASDTVAITYYAPLYTVPTFTFQACGFSTRNGTFTNFAFFWDAEDNVGFMD